MASPEAARIRGQWFPSRSVPESSIDEWRRQAIKDRTGDLLPAGVSVRPDQIGGLHCEWLGETSSRSERVILYLHGGGYVLGGCDTHRNLAARLALSAEARAVGARVSLGPGTSLSGSR